MVSNALELHAAGALPQPPERTMIRITSNLHKNENTVAAMDHDHHGNNQCFIDIKLNRSGIIIMHNIQKERKYFI